MGRFAARQAHTGRTSRKRKKASPKNRRATDRFYAEVARDYALTFERRARGRDEWVEEATDEDERARRVFMQHTPPEAMQRAIEQLERDHGSVEAYLRHAGLDEPRIGRLKRRLVRS